MELRWCLFFYNISKFWLVETQHTHTEKNQAPQKNTKCKKTWTKKSTKERTIFIFFHKKIFFSINRFCQSTQAQKKNIKKKNTFDKYQKQYNKTTKLIFERFFFFSLSNILNQNKQEREREDNNSMLI